MPINLQTAGKISLDIKYNVKTVNPKEEKESTSESPVETYTKGEESTSNLCKKEERTVFS